jgi:hypothetical protein
MTINFNKNTIRILQKNSKKKQKIRERFRKLSRSRKSNIDIPYVDNFIDGDNFIFKKG